MRNIFSIKLQRVQLFVCVCVCVLDEEKERSEKLIFQAV